MNEINKMDVTRRGFLGGSAGLAFAITMPTFMTARPADVAAATNRKEVTAWVHIGTDNSIMIYSPAAEMGQGVNTSLPQIVAEEMDADWSKVVVEQAPHNSKVYGNPGLGGGTVTVASKAVNGYWDRLRQAGAQARKVLINAAAEHWGVNPAEIKTENSFVIHTVTGKKMTYGEVATFAKMPDPMPEVTPADLKKPADYKIVGKSIPRVDLKDKASGKYEYGIDKQLDGMLYASLLRTPVEGAEPTNIQDAAAKKVPGVVGVIPLKDAVGIVGTSIQATKKAKDLLKVDWKGGKIAGYNSEPALAEYVKRAADKSDKGLLDQQVGDAPGAIAKAARVYKADYTSDYTYHAQMEPMNVTAKVDDDGNGADVWAGTQAADLMQVMAALSIGLKPPQVRIHQMGLGGGFGRRIYPDHVGYALQLAKATKKPIKLIWSREDDVAAGKLRPQTAHHLEAGLDEKGRIVGWHHRVVGEAVIGYTGPQARLDAAKGIDVLTMEGAKHEYEIANKTIEFVRAREKQEVALAAWRAIGSGYNKFVIESFMDEIAHAEKKDPIEFRLALLEKDARARRVIETVAKMSDWKRKRENGRALGFAFNHVWETPAAAVIELSVDKATGEVKLHNLWSAVNPGLVINPDGTKAQMESNLIFGLSQALKERITYANGAIQQSNFHDYELIRMNEVPEVFVEVISTNDKPTAMGEVSLPLIGGCVANAIYNACGARVRQMPFTAERIKAAMKA